MNQITVKQLYDLLSRADSVIRESDDADEHSELLRELDDTMAFIHAIVDTSHMGMAAHEVILQWGDTEHEA